MLGKKSSLRTLKQHLKDLKVSTVGSIIVITIPEGDLSKRLLRHLESRDPGTTVPQCHNLIQTSLILKDPFLPLQKPHLFSLKQEKVSPIPKKWLY